MAHAGHGPHADDEHHGHVVADGDDIPPHGPVLEEPKSPFWLPYLGVALFGLAVVWWLSTPSAAEEARAAAASASASAEAAPQANEGNAAPPASAPPRKPGQVPPGLTVSPTVVANPGFKR